MQPNQSDSANQAHSPKIYSDEEIEMFLKGDRRDIDKLLLYTMNRIAAVLIPHAEREDQFMAVIKDVGGLEAVKERADYIDSLIRKNNKRSAAFAKIAESTITWALIAATGFVLAATHSPSHRPGQSGSMRWRRLTHKEKTCTSKTENDLTTMLRW